jgi:hypothetical protein
MRRLYRRTMARLWRSRVRAWQEVLRELGEGSGWEYVYAKGRVYGHIDNAERKVRLFTDAG